MTEHVETREPAELIALCQHCKYKDCIGMCDEYRDAATELLGWRRRKNRLPAPDVIVHDDCYPVTYTIGGDTLTLKEWADKCGINYGTLRTRLYRMSLSEALRMGPARKYNTRANAPKLHAGFGHAYSVKEWVRRTGVNRSTIYALVKRGDSIEEYCRRKGIMPDLE